MLNLIHFREHVIAPTLRHLDLWSESAENLLLGTALVESRLEHLVQLGGGPALGLYQMEPATHDDIWENYLAFRTGRRTDISGFLGRSCHLQVDNSPSGGPSRAHAHLVWNLAYATAMCRVHYLRDPKPLPTSNDVWAMARYWKRVWNTYEGKGTAERYVEEWNRAFPRLS